ncbi:helix-turn-helix domain-containing protein [Mycobacterium sp. BMJ-28]
MTRNVRQERGFDGSRLRAAREHLGMTRADLARRLQTGQDVVLQWESGECQPRPRSMPAIAAAVGVEVTDLYRSDGGAATLAERRVALGLNQADIAKALGVTRATISQWERGSRPVPARHRPAYADLLGLGNDDPAWWARSTVATSSSVQPVPTRRPRRTTRGPAARVAHLIVITDLEFSGGTFLSGDHPTPWRVYSPQGTEVHKTSGLSNEELLEQGAVHLSRLGYRQLCLHHEQRIVIDDEPVRVVRYQTSPPSESRQHLARSFLSQFTPEFYVADVGEDIGEKARIRSEFEHLFPQSVTDEMLFVVAEPTDCYGWLADQTLPYIPYTIVSYLPAAKRPFLAAVHHDHTSVKTNEGLIPFDGLGIYRDTTISQIADKLTQYTLRQPCRSNQ